MKILMLLDRFFPPDIRVEKEARALSQAGHDVFVLSSYDSKCPTEENIGYATILRHIQTQSFAKRALRFAIFSVTGTDLLWQRHIAHALFGNEIDAIHVHDLPLVKTGVTIARKKCIPLVADLHENYPEAVRFYHGNNWKSKIARVIMSEKRWKRFQRAWLWQVDRVITVIDEIGRLLISEYGVPSDKITIVMNAEDTDTLLAIPINENIIRRYEPYFTISYVGGFGVHRGIQTAISAMPGILARVPAARLVLVGSGNNEFALREQARKLGLQDVVEFTGWQPFDLVPSYIAASQTCLIPYISSTQTNASAPHKLFQYMALAKPVIVSSMDSLSRIVQETGAGLVYSSGDAEALAEAVIRIYQDKGLATRLGRAGRKATDEKYSWQAEAQKLVGLYQALQMRNK